MEFTQQERQSWLKFIVLFGFMLLFGVMNVIGGDTDAQFNLDNPDVVTMLNIVWLLMVILLFFLPAVLIARFWTVQKIPYLGLNKKPAASTLLIGGIGMLMAMPLINGLSELNQHMHFPAAFSDIEAWMKNSEDKAAKFTEALTKGTSVGDLIFNLFVVAFMAALSEEIFFRGLFQKITIECFKNKHVGVWIVAIIFSAFHMQFFGFIPRMIMGAYLGYLFLWTGSLWPGILAHFLNNGMAVFLMWLVNRGAVSEDVDKVGSEGGQLIYVIISAALAIGSLLLIYRTEKKKQNLPNT